MEIITDEEIAEEERGMTDKISQCNICSKFFDSKKDLKEHIDKDHRITDSKMIGSRRNNQ
jgi:hypothetical protein